MDTPDGSSLRSRILVPLVLVFLGALSVVGGMSSSTVVLVPVGVVGLLLVIKELLPRSWRRPALIGSGLAVMILAFVGFRVFMEKRSEVGGLVAVGMIVFGGIPGFVVFVIG